MTSNTGPPAPTQAARTNLDVLGVDKELILVHGLEPPDLTLHGLRVPHSLHDVSGARLALGPDHRRSLRDAAQCFSLRTDEMASGGGAEDGWRPRGDHCNDKGRAEERCKEEDEGGADARGYGSR
eukprot:1436589-Rhodomonas_salina.1